jgi:hypothetical protein
MPSGVVTGPIKRIKRSLHSSSIVTHQGLLPLLPIGFLPLLPIGFIPLLPIGFIAPLPFFRPPLPIGFIAPELPA